MTTKTLDRLQVDIKDVKAESGEFEAILSTPTVDRDGEIIDPKAFEPLPDYIPIDIDHSMSVSTTVGSGVPYYDGDVLKFRGSFASTALGQEVRTLVVEGHVRKMSVAFMNARREVDPDDERVHIRQAELLNAAIVPIPSNREADIVAAKASDMKATKAERLQQIHDLAVANGAECKHAPAAEEKSTDTDPEPAAAPAAAAPAEVTVAPQALAALAEAEALLA